MMDDYRYIELKDQIEQEKSFVPTNSNYFGRLDFNFKDFYDNYLSIISFNSFFESLYELECNSSNITPLFSTLETMFKKIISVFKTYSLNVDK